jgi:hypothetical protein
MRIFTGELGLQSKLSVQDEIIARVAPVGNIARVRRAELSTTTRKQPLESNGPPPPPPARTNINGEPSIFLLQNFLLHKIGGAKELVVLL